MAFLNVQQLQNLGLKSFGENVLISDKASLYCAENIQIGSNVRIDDFVVLSAGKGGIDIGSYVHIAVFASLIGAGKITIKDYCNLSSKVAIYSSSDDFSGDYMTNPMISLEFTNVINEDVYLGKHVVLGCGSVVLPGVIIEEGAAIGSLSLVNNNCLGYFIHAGIPAKAIKKRNENLKLLEEKMVNIFL